MKPTYYEMLGVTRSASQAQISEAFRALAAKLHPDRMGGQVIVEFVSVNDAYQALKGESKRQAYDLALDMRYHECERCGKTGQLQKTIGFTHVELRVCPACNGSGIGAKK